MSIQALIDKATNNKTTVHIGTILTGGWMYDHEESNQMVQVRSPFVVEEELLKFYNEHCLGEDGLVRTNKEFLTNGLSSELVSAELKGDFRNPDDLNGLVHVDVFCEVFFSYLVYAGLAKKVVHVAISLGDGGDGTPIDEMNVNVFVEEHGNQTIERKGEENNHE